MTRQRLSVHDDASLALAVLSARVAFEGEGAKGAQVTKLSTVVAELGRNILKYADRGWVVLQPVEDGRRRGLEVEARDRGPGIADAESAMLDTWSSGGTLGLGLPGVRRMADHFDLRTAPGEGTTVVVRMWVRS